MEEVFLYSIRIFYEANKFMKRVLITGAAGFVGMHAAKALAARGDFCIGIDNFNPYYPPLLKRARALELKRVGVDVLDLDLLDQSAIESLILSHHITHVIHLAAQAGVRHSLSYPNEYLSSNIEGFVSILEILKKTPSIRLIYASSSSVYGLNKKIPFSVEDPTDSPANLYGATKKANELIAHAYHHLYGIHVTGLRYFTIYGPWGRPDMAYYRFADQISQNIPIQVFNHGEMKRDFTYIDDIVNGTLAALDLGAKCEVFNLGNHHPINLLTLIERLEEALNQKAIKQMLPMQPGEVIETFADIEKSKKMLGFTPKVSLEEGILRFVEWFKSSCPLSESAKCRR